MIIDSHYFYLINSHQNIQQKEEKQEKEAQGIVYFINLQSGSGGNGG